MTSATLSYTCHSIPQTQGVERSYPVPRRGLAVDDSAALFRRCAIASVLLHLAIAAIALVIQHWPSSTMVGTPQDQILNVSIIPLSALDTILPKGSSAEKEPPLEIKKEDTIAEPPAPKLEKKSQPKKIIAAKSIATVRQEPRHQQDKNSKETGEQRNGSQEVSQQTGVADGEAVSLEQARVSYQDMVATRLARAKRYPERALKRRMTGEGTIRIEISANGSLSGFQIIQSTATPILDEELRAMVERASPFPAFPADLRKGSLALVVPVAFRLEG